MKPNELDDFLHRSKMTGNELAAKLGVHYVTISRWRNGREPIPKTVELAMKWLEWEPLGAFTQPDMTVPAPAIAWLSK